MKTVKYSIADLNFSNSIIKDYLRNGESVEYQSFQPSLEGVQEALAERNFQIEQRKTLVSVLHKQLEEVNSLSSKEHITNQIDQLKSSDVFTITTGQQLHPFLGPGYVVIKILETIKLCKEINDSSVNTKKVIPVFWLASEDHDTLEISEIRLFGDDIKFDFPDNIATGKIPTQLLQEGIQKIQQKLGNEAQGYSFFQLCKKAYEEHDNLSQATRAIVYELFGKDGILVIDADDDVLKQQFKNIVQEEIEQQTTTKIQKKVKEDFENKGWHYQVTPRTNNLFTIDKVTFERSKVTAEKYSPDYNYSPNALLRPLYQETILPNVAYIGGMAEVNYWLQLYSIFKHYKVQMPVIWGRNSYTISKAKQVEKLEQMDQTEVVNYEETAIAQRYLKDHKPLSLVGEAVKLNEKIKNKSKNYNSTEWVNLHKSFENILVELKKVERGEKNDLLHGDHYKKHLQLVQKAHTLFFNKDHFQERMKSILELDLNYNYSSEIRNMHKTEHMSLGEYYIIGN